MGKAVPKSRLGRTDWVLAGFRALVRGGIAAVRVEPLARDLNATKGSFYWHFKDLPDLHQAMLDLWEGLATSAITAHVRQSGLDPMGQLMLLVDMVSIRPGEAFGGVEIEPALRDWGRSDPRARAVVERVDRQRLSDLAGFLRAVGLEESELLPRAQLIYAAVIGLESLRLTTGQDMAPPLRSLVVQLAGQHGASGRTSATRQE
ncbi:TetR/AcrR family transcriptional regulator [Tabrizicola flagellatus]|uniref:TetR/AcrR family transcriptional regulator n=1 Tax=Tabrizicola flagellatus TaxID=2593021 RepID=UPI00135CCBA7|nr:TetR/AcrR family transcriptional regulator [Tabrizicola flagellatus]